MANISTYLQKILAAVYGEEVRSSIHDALAAMNVESSNAMQFASTAKDSAQASAAEAKTSASTATQKATAASVSAQAAKTSENNAKVSESNASNKAKEATDAADAAKASEIAAGSSAAIASQKAGEAATSQAAAALSEAEAKAAEERIKTIKGDHTPGTTDIYTVTMTDGTSYPVSVYNGRNGTGAGDVLGIWFDLVLPADGWKDGEITIADSRLLALATHKYFISADEASRDEFLDCKVQPKDITTTGFITFKSETDPAEDLTVNVIRFELSANGA